MNLPSAVWICTVLPGPTPCGQVTCMNWAPPLGLGCALGCGCALLKELFSSTPGCGPRGGC